MSTDGADKDDVVVPLRNTQQRAGKGGGTRNFHWRRRWSTTSRRRSAGSIAAQASHRYWFEPCRGTHLDCRTASATGQPERDRCIRKAGRRRSIRRRRSRQGLTLAADARRPWRYPIHQAALTVRVGLDERRRRRRPAAIEPLVHVAEHGCLNEMKRIVVGARPFGKACLAFGG